MEPTSDFWSFLFVAVLSLTLIAVVGGVFALKFFVFRPAERRAKREADADGNYGPMERTELVSLIKKLDDRNEENIVAREIAKQKFLADFREELMEPLTLIKQESAVLAQLLAGEEAASVSHKINRNATQLEGLIMDLYELYLLEVGRAQLTQEAVSIKELLDEIKSRFKLISDDSSNTLEINVDPKITTIVTDYGKVKKLLECLIDAANSYTSQGLIHLNIGYAEDGRLRIVVSDDGGERPELSRRDWCGLRLPLIKKLTEFLGGGFDFHQSPTGAESIAIISVRQS